MNKFILLFFFLLFASSGNAQKPCNLDSIQVRLKNYDTLKGEDADLLLGEVSEALKQLGKGCPPVKKALTFKQFGLVAMEIGDWQLALEANDEAIRILRAENEVPHKALSRVYIDLGNIYIAEAAYYERGRLFSLADSSSVQATVNYKVALKYADSANCAPCKAKALLNLGATYINLFEDEKAIGHLNDAMNLAISLKDTSLMAHIWVNKGNLADYGGEREKAREFYLKAIDFFKGTSDFSNWVNTSISLTTLYGPNEWEKAIALLGEADSLCKANNLMTQQGLIQEFLFKIYKDQGKHREALVHLEAYRTIQDSLLNSSFKDKELRVRYEAAKKQELLERERAENLQKELALEKSERRSQAYRMYLTIGAALSLVLIAFLVWRTRTQKIINSQEEQIHKQRLQELEQSKKIESAKALLSGQDKERVRISEEIHDKLGGTLVAARMWSELGGSDKEEANENVVRTKNLLDQAIEDARTIAHNLHPSALTKFGLPSALQELIESFCFPNGPTITADISEVRSLDPQQEFQLYRITQEVLNNAIKHSAASAIKIALFEDEKNQVNLSISDNGKGFNPSLVKEGIGLKTIHSRVNSLSAVVSIDSSPGKGTTYTVTLNALLYGEGKHSIS